MEPKITKVARDELARAVRHRYLGATGGEKSRILGEFIANSGYHPKYAIEILNRTECGSKPAQCHGPGKTSQLGPGQNQPP